MIIAECLAAIAEQIERGRDDAALPALLAQARASCAASTGAPAGVKPMLTQMQQALETWATVWPRLGSQREFRQAVVREARLWAKRFEQAS